MSDKKKGAIDPYDYFSAKKKGISLEQQQKASDSDSNNDISENFDNLEVDMDADVQDEYSLNNDDDFTLSASLKQPHNKSANQPESSAQKKFKELQEKQK